MPTNFKEFSRAVLDFKQTLLPEQYVLFQKKLAFQLLTGVVNKTPVDTGRARGNWQVGIDEIPSGELDKVDKGGGASISAGGEALASLQPGLFQIVYIANNLPYIVPLEDGHSGQAPQGMLALTITEIETQFNRVE